MRSAATVLSIFACLLATAAPAFAGETVEGRGWSLDLPDGFVEMMSMEGGGRFNVSSRFSTLPIEGVPEIRPGTSFTALLWVALGPTALAALVQVRIIQTAGALFMSQVSYMVPVWSVIFGVLVLGETLPGQLYVALGLILSGIGLSQWSAYRRKG